MSVMSADILTNTSDTRLAVSRFITWASEPKSPEVRKVELHCDSSVHFLYFLLTKVIWCLSLIKESFLYLLFLKIELTLKSVISLLQKKYSSSIISSL